MGTRTTIWEDVTVHRSVLPADGPALPNTSAPRAVTSPAEAAA